MQIDHLAEELSQARQRGAAYAPVSAGLQALNLDDAYAIQRRFVELQLSDERVAGFKAALTAAAAQKAFGVAEPVTGVLFDSGERLDGARIAADEFRNLLIETELGFRLGERIDAPVPDLETLQTLCSTCQPMIELADPGFGQAGANGLDLVAANAASASFLHGEVPEWRHSDLNALSVSLSRDGELLQQGLAGEVMDDQWQALHWLVNRIVGQGYTIEPGHILMTGSIGGMQPGRPGVYVADFGELGSLRFEISDAA
jgi:2-keto-4-pentenoate hydratase